MLLSRLLFDNNRQSSRVQYSTSKSFKKYSTVYVSKSKALRRIKKLKSGKTY